MTEYHRPMWCNRGVWAVAAVLAVAALTAVAPPARAKVRAPAPVNCTEPGERITPVPWPQDLLDPEQAWSFTRGGGVTVALLASGVDGRHPQLGNRVLAGFDALGATARGFISMSEVLHKDSLAYKQYKRCPGSAEAPAADHS